MLLRLCFLFFILVSSSSATQTKETQEQIGVYEHLGDTVPLNLTFTDEYNKTKTLKEFIRNKPTVLTLNYYSCKALCSPLLTGVSAVLNKLDLKPYIDYNALTISIDPRDNFQTALAKKQTHLKMIEKPFPPQTWSFLTGSQENINKITDAVGFKYKKRIKDGVIDYLHPGVIIVLSPNGKISRYLNGVDYLPFDLKLALLEAKEERVGPTIAKTLLFCFAYDAKSKTYVFQAEKVIGILMFLIVAIFFIYLVKTGRKKQEKDDE
jgi:protein SCO1/2